MLPDPATRFNICHVWINVHSSGYERLVAPIRGTLADLGYECAVNVNQAVAGAVNIVVGPLIYAWRFRGHVIPSVIERNYVLYQTAQLDENNPVLRDQPSYAAEAFAQAAVIWEHSLRGMTYFKSSPWLAKVRYVPPGFHRCLETFAPRPDPQIDVLCHGQPSPRRSRIMNQLSERGLKAVLLSGISGEAFDAAAMNAKIVLRVHNFDGAATDTPSFPHLLANRCFVVAETADYTPLSTGVVYAKYDDLVETCVSFLGPRAADRAAIADKGYDAVRRFDMVDSIRQAIAQLPIAELTRED